MLEHLVLRHLSNHVRRHAQRILQLGQPLDEARPAFEQLGELVGCQLPR